MSNIHTWLPRDWNVICDVCGKKRKRSECVNAFGSGDIANIVSCRDGCADKRHPLNTPPPIIFDGQPVPDARPEGTDVYISTASTQTSAYRFGVSWPGPTFALTNQDESQFNLNYAGPKLWGSF